MAATNAPETLDAALTRPGRFDRNVVVWHHPVWIASVLVISTEYPAPVCLS